MNNYDIAIIGGGPAGLSAAYSAAGSGSHVILFEKDASIAQYIRTSGVTWTKEIEKFGISKEYYNPVYNYSFISPSNDVTLKGNDAEACVLDVRRTYQFLAFEAAEAGAEIMLRSNVVDVRRNLGDQFSKLKLKTPKGERSIRCTLVIDATGFNSVVAQKLGLVKQWRRYGVGAEYECYCEIVDPRTWHLMVGSLYSKAGYAWVFPVSENRIRIGVGVCRPDSKEDPIFKLHQIMDKKFRPLDKMGKIQPVELHFGYIPNEGVQRSSIYDGLILVGDSAGQSNPLVLEGIRFAVEFGRLAGEVGAKSISEGSDKASLIDYEKSWRRKIESKINSALKVQSRWMALSDREWDDEIEILRDLSMDEFLDFIRAEFTFKSMLKLAMNHPKIGVRNLFNLVINR